MDFETDQEQEYADKIRSARLMLGILNAIILVGLIVAL